MAARRRSRGRWPAPATWGALVIAAAAFPVAAAALGPEADAAAESAFPRFYRDVPYGSEGWFNPVSSFGAYSLDTLQVPESFSMSNSGQHLKEVGENLIDPFEAIDDEGGWKQFVNQQILPIDPENFGDSVAMIPNYALHLLGGGLVYRKNVEWLELHGFPFPRTAALVLAVGAEYLQEGLEYPATSDDDAIADFWIFRPAGMLLFSWKPFARFMSEKLDMVEWAHLTMFESENLDFANVGENYAVRPTFFGMDRHRPFLYFGMNPLFGVSHRLDEDDSISWGAGAAMVDSNSADFTLRPSGGLFWDRNDSLLASAIFNATHDLAMRVNVYPGVLFAERWWSPGVYLGVKDHGSVEAGLVIRFTPAGLAVAFH